MTVKEPENATLDEVLRGEMLSSGYLPGSVSGRYMELWKYRGYIYAVVQENTSGGNFVPHKIGIAY